MSADSMQSINRSGNWLLLLMLLCGTIFLKFAIPFGSGQLFLSFFIMCGVAGVGFLASLLEIHWTRLALYLLMVSVLVLTQLIGGYEFSSLSLLMLVIIHLPYIFRMREGVATPGIELKYFQKIAVLLAAIGVAQYFGQYLTGPDIAFFLDTRFPQNFIMQGFHGLNPLQYQGNVYKANGFFHQEPSNFSQFLALAIVFQVLFFQVSFKLQKIALFALCLALTFSGTGILILLVFVPIYLIQKRRFLILGFMLLMVLLAPFWSPLVGLERTVNRADEIFTENTSAQGRFVSPARLIDDYVISGGLKDTLLGLGAGSMGRSAAGSATDYFASQSTWGKIFFEYGLIGTIFYFGFMIFIFLSSGKNPYVMLVLFIQYILLGEHVFPPTCHALILALLAWPRTPKDFNGRQESNQVSTKTEELA